jgi:hypothetical protein
MPALSSLMILYSWQLLMGKLSHPVGDDLGFFLNYIDGKVMLTVYMIDKRSFRGQFSLLYCCSTESG